MALVEPDEQFFLSFSLPLDLDLLGSYGSRNESRVTIIDDDSVLSSDSAVVIAVATVAGVMVLVILVIVFTIIGVCCARKRTKAKLNIGLVQLPPKGNTSTL